MSLHIYADPFSDEYCAPTYEVINGTIAQAGRRALLGFTYSSAAHCRNMSNVDFAILSAAAQRGIDFERPLAFAQQGYNNYFDNLNL